MQARINITINELLLKRMKAVSDETGIPVSKIIEKSVEAWISKYEK